jgi:hypothetical protein
MGKTNEGITVWEMNRTPASYNKIKYSDLPNFSEEIIGQLLQKNLQRGQNDENEVDCAALSDAYQFSSADGDSEAQFDRLSSNHNETHQKDEASKKEASNSILTFIKTTSYG